MQDKELEKLLQEKADKTEMREFSQVWEEIKGEIVSPKPKKEFKWKKWFPSKTAVSPIRRLLRRDRFERIRRIKSERSFTFSSLIQFSESKSCQCGTDDHKYRRRIKQKHHGKSNGKNDDRALALDVLLPQAPHRIENQNTDADGNTAECVSDHFQIAEIL